MMVYSVTTIMFCFMLSVFFSRASTAAAVAGLLWFITYLPYIVLEQNFESTANIVKIAFCLFGNTALGLGLNVIFRHEAEQEGIQWRNVFTPVNSDVNFHLGHVLIMLMVDAALYLLIALYVEKILPGDYGLAEKWNFPFTLKFWRGETRNETPLDLETEISSNRQSFEESPKGKTVGVAIRNLRKVFVEKVAVEGLNLDIYEGQITVLLGHNSAGKTTIISMLTGMISPTSGTVIINGKTIKSARGSIGFCPQNNILFGE
jgi:ATP-binding cassette, subfamily A (ABC1), member 3